MLGPQHIGQRVVVRRIVGLRHGRPLLTDALGLLREITDDTLTIETDAGPVTIDRQAVVAAKPVPPRPPKRAPRRPPPPGA